MSSFASLRTKHPGGFNEPKRRRRYERDLAGLEDFYARNHLVTLVVEIDDRAIVAAKVKR
ncbi:hypothetical protein AJ87_09865 [Rhizobium yanglingense]|nr:hypothetical protein AJ87_09865 [Rhizobium yanglingense]